MKTVYRIVWDARQRSDNNKHLVSAMTFDTKALAMKAAQNWLATNKEGIRSEAYRIVAEAESEPKQE